MSSKARRPSLVGVAGNSVDGKDPDTTRLLIAVGRVITDFSPCETFLAIIYQTLCGGNLAASVSFGSVISLESRFGMVSAAASITDITQMPYPREQVEDLMKIIEKLKQSSRLRNNVAHSVAMRMSYRYSDDTEVTVNVVRPPSPGLKGYHALHQPKYEYDADDLEQISKHFLDWHELLNFCLFSFHPAMPNALGAWDQRPKTPNMPDLKPLRR